MASKKKFYKAGEKEAPASKKAKAEKPKKVVSEMRKKRYGA